MENPNLLWQSSVKKAFYGYATLAICGVLSSLCTLLLLINGNTLGVLPLYSIILIISLVGSVFYYLGVDGMKKAASYNSALYDGIAKLYKGSLWILLSYALTFVISILTILFSFAMLGQIAVPLSSILSLVGYFFIYKGFTAISKLPLDNYANKGAKQLKLMALLSIIVYFVGILPIIGRVIGLILLVAIVVYTFLGWKNFSLATFDIAINTQTNDIIESEKSSTEYEDESTEEEEAESSFLLNRWISRLSRWFDRSVFELDLNSSTLCVVSMWIGILTGASIAVVAMINDSTNFEYWALSIGGAIILLLITLQAIKDIKKLSTGAQIAGRLAYLILLPLALAFIGGILAAIAVVVVAIILILWFFITMLFGTSGKVKLSNGDVVRNDGLIGGYRGKSGKKYTKNLDGTYSSEE